MPLDFFPHDSISPQLESIRLSEETRVREVARQAAEQAATAKTKATFTSRQKITFEERKVIMRVFANWGLGREVRWTETREIMEENDSIREIVNRLINEYREEYEDKALMTVFNCYRA